MSDRRVGDTGFYSSKKWIQTRDIVKKRDRMICQHCHRPILHRYIVDHIIPLTLENYHDANLAYGLDNLQLLCQDCHNEKTFSHKPKRFNLW